MNIAIISKCYSRWHEPLKAAFLKIFDKVEYIYINKLIQERKVASYGSCLVKDLGYILREYNTTHLVFDLEFSMLLLPNEVAMIVDMIGVPSFGIAMDDDRFHDINRRVYEGVDAVLTFPLSVERYRLIMKEAYPFFPFFELSFDNQLEMIPQKEIDVLFYGDLKADRKEKIELLRANGIAVHVVDFSTSYEELCGLISKAKITLNFSKGSPIVTSAYNFIPFMTKIMTPFFTKQLKSRIFEIAACKSLCVSESFAFDSYVFSKNAMPTFSTDQEMVSVIHSLLSDNLMYESKLRKFLDEFKDKYCFDKRLKSFNAYIQNLPTKQTKEISPIPMDFLVSGLVTKAIYTKNIFLLSPHTIKGAGSFVKRLSASLLAWPVLFFSLLRAMRRWHVH